MEVNNWSSKKKRRKIVENNLVSSFVVYVLCFSSFCNDTNDNQLAIYSSLK